MDELDGSFSLSDSVCPVLYYYGSSIQYRILNLDTQFAFSRGHTRSVRVFREVPVGYHGATYSRLQSTLYCANRKVVGVL